MIIDKKLISKAIDEAIEKSVLKKEGKPDKVRKFDESIELIINVRELDIKNPNNRIDQEHVVPHPINDKWKICVFASGDLEFALKKYGATVINSENLELLQKKGNREKKQSIKRFDYFVAQSDLMRNVAKVLARFLGQRNKMPKPQPKGFGVINSNENLDEYFAKLKCIVRLDMKKQLLIQTKVGKKSMPKEHIFENLDSVLNIILARLPNGQNNVKSLYIKTSMGAAIKVEEGVKK